MALKSLASLVGCCLAITSPTSGWWPSWEWSSGNQTGLLDGRGGGDPPAPPPPETPTSSISVWWSEWNFRVLFGWATLSIFSTPDQPGSLRTDGGWILYFTDQAGLWLFGHYWPTVGWTGLGLFTLGCLVALAWVLRTCEKWCSCLGCCCKRNRPAALPPVVDAALHHLPVTPSPAAFQRVSLVGRNGGTLVGH